MADSKTWLANIANVRSNPAAIQRLALSTLEDVTGGKIDIVDATNPFVYLMEMSAHNSSAAMVQNGVLNAKQYPSMAVTEEDLYLHMADADYIGRFATPSRTVFTILLNKDELYRRAVSTGVGDIRKLTIPRHSNITVAGVVFTMQYPIDIRVMAHGGLQIVYDVDQVSPLQTLTTNIVDWRVVNLEGVDYVKIDFPVSQFQITTNYGQLTLATGFTKGYAFPDDYYYARVFYAIAGGKWKEMSTTHTDQVFDPTKPTALLRVTAGKLSVSIPQVYLTTNLVNREIRVDIYTTKGPLDMILDNYQMNNFVAKWVDLEGDAGGVYIAPLTNFTNMAVYSDKTVSGGTSGLTFEQLRNRVMTNSLGSANLPITNVQVTTRLEDLGYAVVKDVDNITNRQFLATRLLPKPTDDSVVAGAGCTIQTLTASMTDLVSYDTVMDNGNRITLLPSTLYQNINGLVQIVPDLLVAELLSLPLDVRARRINESSYLYTPFHYVLDMNNDRFEHRGYYLDNPGIESKSFVDENDTAGIAISTGKYQIERVSNGYKLTLICRSSDAWRSLSDNNVFCQLSYRPAGEKDRAYLNGTLEGMVDDERVYSFLLGTDYDVDADDNLVLNTFSMYNNPSQQHATALISDFDVTFVASELNTAGLQSSILDEDLGKVLLPVSAIGIARERLRIRLGTALHGLWSSSRSVVSSMDYQRYLADVPAVWEQTIYQRDPLTGSIIMTVNGADIEYVVLHAKGDPVMDGADIVYRYRKGDPVMDADGHPVVVSTRKMVRQIDLLFLDGVYWFASESTAVKYKKSLPDTIAGWLVNDIANVTRYLLEQTRLFFYPKSTLGQVPALVREDETVTLSAEQSFSVTYYLSGVAYRDTALRAALTKMAVQTINEVLQSSTVTMSEITSTLRARAGGDAIAVDVSGLGGSQNLAAVTLKNDAARLSIKKVAVALADGTIGVEDDVAVAFLQHTSY